MKDGRHPSGPAESAGGAGAEAETHGAGAQADADDAGARADEAGAGARVDAEHAAAEEERVRAVVEELRRLRVRDLALDMAVSLVTVGYQKLGLTEQTRELRDLDEARLSIELLRASLDVLERERGAEGLADLRSTLAAMQLNYARAVGESAPEAAEAGAEALADEGPAGEESPGDAASAEEQSEEGGSTEGASSAGEPAADG